MKPSVYSWYFLFKIQHLTNSHEKKITCFLSLFPKHKQYTNFYLPHFQEQAKQFSISWSDRSYTQQHCMNESLQLKMKEMKDANIYGNSVLAQCQCMCRETYTILKAKLIKQYCHDYQCWKKNSYRIFKLQYQKLKIILFGIF